MHTPAKIIVGPLLLLSFGVFLVSIVLDLPVLAIIASYSFWGLAAAYTAILFFYKNELAWFIVVAYAAMLYIHIKQHDQVIVGITAVMLTLFIANDFFQDQPKY